MCLSAVRFEFHYFHLDLLENFAYLYLMSVEKARDPGLESFTISLFVVLVLEV